MTDFARLIGALGAHGVEFILIGGVAATVHGATRLTQDVDVVYARGPENLQRVIDALTPFDPYPRGAPAGLPFRWDVVTLAHGLNFTLTTTVGDIDLLGEIVGGGGHADLLPDTMMVQVFGWACRCLTLERLIAVKRAAGRPKDYEALAELEALRKARRPLEGSDA